MGGLTISHVFNDSFFKQKINCSVLQIEWVGGHTVGHILWAS